MRTLPIFPQPPLTCLGIHMRGKGQIGLTAALQKCDLLFREKLGSRKDIAVTLNHKAGQGAQTQKVEVNTIHCWNKGHCRSGTFSQDWKSVMRSRLAIPFMPVLQRDSAPRAGGEFAKRSCILDKNPGKSPAFHLPDRDCWA